MKRFGYIKVKYDVRSIITGAISDDDEEESKVKINDYLAWLNDFNGKMLKAVCKVCKN
jgi:hypothetical protein